MPKIKEHLGRFIDEIPILAWCCGADGSVEYLNKRWLDYTGMSEQQALGWGWKDCIHPDDTGKLIAKWRAILNSSEPGQHEARMRRFDGVYRWFLFGVEPFRDELGNVVKWYGTNADIEDRKRAETLLAEEKHLLEMVAKDSSLEQILDGVCRLIEGQAIGLFAAIMLLDKDTNRLWHAAAPSLPESYTTAIDGILIGPAVGSCGTAAYRREQVISSDIATDPLWTDYRHLPLAHGLRACWSTPILSSQDSVLGTFAIHSQEPGEPTAEQLRIIDQITHLTSVAIERKRTEAALRESEERFRRMADTIPEVMWFTALDPEKVLYASPSFERIWGLPVEDLYRNPRLWTETIHPEDRERVVNTFSRWIAGERISYNDLEYRVVQPNGATRWIHERGVLSRNQQGNAYLASGISTDITERKLAEEVLQRSEAYLAEAQRLSLTGSFGWKVSNGELLWSDETFCILGYDKATKPALDRVFERIHPDDTAYVQRTLDSGARDGRDFDFEHRLQMPDGKIKCLHVVARAVREETGGLEFVGAVMDITAQKSAQQALERAFQETQALKEQFRLAIDTIPGLVWSGLPDGHIDFLNQRWLEYTGMTLDQADGWGWRAAIHPDDLPGLESYWRSLLASGRPGETEARLRRFDGAYRWFLFRGVPLYDGSGELVKWYGQTTDIDDRKRAEQRLLAQHTVTQMLAKATSLEEAAPGILRVVCEFLLWDLGALWSLDRQASVLRCVEIWHSESLEVPHFEAMSRASTFMPAIGLPGRVWSSREPIYISDVVHDANFERAPIAAREGLHAAFGFPILLGREALGVMEFFSREIRQPDRDLLDMMAALGSQIGQFIERKRAENELQHAQVELAHVTRVTTLGEMTASIAHEINQPLAAIVNNAGACLRWLAAGNMEESRHSAELVMADGHRAGDIIARIRTLAKKTPPRKEWLAVNEVILEVLELMQAAMQKHQISLQTRFSNEIPLVHADRVQVQQVLLNLIVNSIEAMSGVGENSRELILSTARDKAHGVQIEVHDSGVGLDPVNNDHLFEAFYTTKPRGMGMGLAISRTIVEAHGGRIWASANETRGMTFHIALPTAEE